jgi:hypothetical protein
VFFHGTTKEFDTFNTEPWGCYFTDRESYAAKFAVGGRILRVHLYIRNPANLRDLREVSTALREANPGKSFDNRDYFSGLKARGFDGFAPMGDTEVIAFYPNQIVPITQPPVM